MYVIKIPRMKTADFHETCKQYPLVSFSAFATPVGNEKGINITPERRQVTF